MSYSLGIDIGTTFVAAALARPGAAEMIPLGSRAVLAPAAVYLRKDGTVLTGEVALTGEAAGLPGRSRTDRICRDFMNRLGDPAPVVLGGEPYDLTAVLGVLLSDVVQKATESQGEPPEHTVLTHPASWGPFRCALYGEVARQAGLVRPGMVTEPEAAVAHYTASHPLDDGATIAVYDLGGSTFNATVLRKQPGGLQILGEPERLEHLGGDTLDEAILSYVNDSARGEPSQLDTRYAQASAMLANLRQTCVSAKETLSADTTTTFPVTLPNRRFDIRLDRSDFEDLARGPIQSTLTTLFRTLWSAQVEPAELSAVLLVGGSAQIPLIAKLVAAELGCPVVVDPHPQHTVALGAAALAAQTVPPHRPAAHPGQPADPAANASGHHDTPLAIPAQHATAVSPPATPVPPAPPALSSSPSPPPAGRPLPRRRHGRSKGGGPPSAGRARRPRVLLGTGVVVALTGMIALVILSGRSATPTAVPSGSPPPSKTEPAAVAEVGPQITPPPTVAATVRVASNPDFVAVSPDGKHAYTANHDTQLVTVVDTATNQMIKTIPIAAGPPQFLTFASDGRTLYITLFNDQRTIHAIDVLDTASNTVVATIPQPARPYFPAVSPDGTRLYVPNYDIGAVSVIDTATNTVTGQIEVPSNPHCIAFSPDGSRAYAANHESNVVSVIDTATLAVRKTIPVGTSPHSIAVNPRRPLVADVNFDSDSVSAIDTTTEKVVATIPVGNHPEAIAWAPDGRFAYVVNQGSNTVSVIDATTNQVTATLPTETNPTSIAVLPDGRRAYVSNLGSGTLTVLELTN